MLNPCKAIAPCELFRIFQKNNHQMKKFKYLFCLLASCSLFSLQAQVDVTKDGYGIKVVKSVECTPVKSQDRTGTCWSFATASFLESEVIRKGNGFHDLSEMFVVKNVYKNKAKNYVLRQGKANFSQGSLSHDLIAVAHRYGVVPESVYSGKLEGEKKHDHREMIAVLKGMLDGVLKRKKPSQKWSKAFDAVVATYLGDAPENFSYEGKTYTPKSFVEHLDINPKDYVSITSYTHHPFYESFILEIPDNYSNGSFYNVPLNDFQKIVDHALNNGFSIAWDGDVSEDGFSAKKGMAILPVDEDRKDLFTQPGKELAVSQTTRQETFESFATTDDHLMHVTGIAKDKDGTKYYQIKNSWGEISDFKGFLYMSEAYFQMKTVAVMVHKDAIPKDIAKKMAL